MAHVSKMSSGSAPQPVHITGITPVLDADVCGMVNLGDESVSFQDNANTFYVGNSDILQTAVFEVSM